MPEDLKRFTISIKSWRVCFIRFQITLLQDRQTDRQTERKRERVRGEDGEMSFIRECSEIESLVLRGISWSIRHNETSCCVCIKLEKHSRQTKFYVNYLCAFR